MMGWLSSVGRWLVLLIALDPIVGKGESHDLGSVSEVKAAFVYNFLQFTSWPDSPNMGNGDLTLCAYVRGTMADSLATLEGRPVESRHIHVKLWPDSPRGCQIVFLSAMAAETHGAAILYALRQSVNLAIAEDIQTPTEGISIGLLEDGDRLAFTINLEVARKHGLKFSSKLLRLAKSVYPRPEDEP